MEHRGEMKATEVFFDLLQLGLAEDEVLAKEGAFSPVFSAFRSLSPEEWEALFALARKQALIGICFHGIERLPQAVRPGKALLMRWWALTQQIEERNRVMDERTGEVCRYFEEAGFRVCVLKGQGNARMYPEPLRRQSGDVDVWVVDGTLKSRGDLRDSRWCVLHYILKQYPDVHYKPLHADYPMWKDTPVEVHFYPSYLKAPLSMHRLLHFFASASDAQFSNRVTLGGQEVSVPTVGFNLVFQLCHIFEHFITQGVGLRQVVDYYYLLLHATETDRREAMAVIRNIHFADFTGALMWVLGEVTRLDCSKMLVQPDEKKGRVLLAEILAGGNFGQYESRYWRRDSSQLHRYVQKVRRLSHFVWTYPREVFWDPWFRIEQWLWRGQSKRRLQKARNGDGEVMDRAE